MSGLLICRHVQQLPTSGCAVAMGFFDGVHIGHRAVIQSAVNYASAHGLDSAVFTFGLPASHQMKGMRLMDPDEKVSRIESLGVQHYLEPPFEEFCNFTPEQFVNDMLAGLYHAKAVFCGDNFTFGKKAAGNVALLKELCAGLGIAVHIVPMARFEGATVSSTRIRTALAEGDISSVNAMLGEAYGIEFPVVHGKHLGSKLGVPTINQIYPEGFQLPRLGIYITRVYLDGQWRPAATGLGSRPTVNSDAANVTCETYVPDYSGDVYGQRPRLEFFRYLCPSKKFDSLDELRDCIHGAARAAQEYFMQSEE